ncbi:hypothetical protein ACFQO4_02250 [Saliphagus sp. GCM10025334]
MADRIKLTRVIAQCPNCGNVYASYVWPDGSVKPIGQQKGCSCGSTDFIVLDENRTAVEPLPGTENERNDALGGPVYPI